MSTKHSGATGVLPVGNGGTGTRTGVQRFGLSVVVNGPVLVGWSARDLLQQFLPAFGQRDAGGVEGPGDHRDGGPLGLVDGVDLLNEVVSGLISVGHPVQGGVDVLFDGAHEVSPSSGSEAAISDDNTIVGERSDSSSGAGAVSGSPRSSSSGRGGRTRIDQSEGVDR